MTRREQKANIILLALIFIQIIAIIGTRYIRDHTAYDPEKAGHVMKYDSLSKVSKTRYRAQENRTANTAVSVAIPVVFDPNSASEDEWIGMGIDEKIAARIRKYISKGGRFRVKEDVKRIYGFKEADYEMLKDYMNIKERPGPATNHQSKRSEFKKEKRPLMGQTDINTATLEELDALPSIGQKRAERIIKYRDLLGGYHDIEQLREVYSIDSATFGIIQSLIICNNLEMKRININDFDPDTTWHPYLGKSQIWRLYRYSQNHGRFNSLDEVCGAALLNDKECAKIAPYLLINPDLSE